ncbi:MAG: hypothetical protein IJT40_01925 [Firmicutes bacterium]|nr:hypothetical protein [Bacillota bacterium]
MKKIKGCINPGCIAKKKKITYALDDYYCSKCGEPVYYVCRWCRKPLEEGDGAFCADCQAKMDARKQQVKDSVFKVGSTAKDAATKTFGFITEGSKKLYETAILGVDEEEEPAPEDEA